MGAHCTFNHRLVQFSAVSNLVIHQWIIVPAWRTDCLRPGLIGGVSHPWKAKHGQHDQQSALPSLWVSGTRLLCQYTV